MPITNALTRIKPLWGRTPGPPTFQLFKLRGSINWLYSGSEPNTGEPIYYLPVGDWSSDYGRETASDCAAAVGDKVPFIVPPLMEKTAFFRHETVRFLWDLAGRALLNAGRVFCMGYSLPPTDLTMKFFLADNRPSPKPPLFVVDPSQETAARIRRGLDGALEVDDTFVGVRDPIPEFVQALVSGGVPVTDGR